MARTLKTYTCVKCGLPFTKWVGGIIPSPEEKRLMIQPVCDKCRAKAVGSVLGKFGK